MEKRRQGTTRIGVLETGASSSGTTASTTVEPSSSAAKDVAPEADTASSATSPAALPSLGGVATKLPGGSGEYLDTAAKAVKDVAATKLDAGQAAQVGAVVDKAAEQAKAILPGAASDNSAKGTAEGGKASESPTGKTNVGESKAAGALGVDKLVDDASKAVVFGTSQAGAQTTTAAASASKEESPTVAAAAGPSTSPEKPSILGRLFSKKAIGGEAAPADSPAMVPATGAAAGVAGMLAAGAAAIGVAAAKQPEGGSGSGMATQAGGGGLDQYVDQAAAHAGKLMEGKVPEGQAKQAQQVLEKAAAGAKAALKGKDLKDLPGMVGLQTPGTVSNAAGTAQQAAKDTASAASAAAGGAAMRAGEAAEISTAAAADTVEKAKGAVMSSLGTATEGAPPVTQGASSAAQTGAQVSAEPVPSPTAAGGSIFSKLAAAVGLSGAANSVKYEGEKTPIQAVDSTAVQLQAAQDTGVAGAHVEKAAAVLKSSLAAEGLDTPAVMGTVDQVTAATKAQLAGAGTNGRATDAAKPDAGAGSAAGASEFVDQVADAVKSSVITKHLKTEHVSQAVDSAAAAAKKELDSSPTGPAKTSPPPDAAKSSCENLASLEVSNTYKLEEPASYALQHVRVNLPGRVAADARFAPVLLASLIVFHSSKLERARKGAIFSCLSGICNSIAHGIQVIFSGIASFFRSIVEGIRSCISGIFGSCGRCCGRSTGGRV
ncbi:hypothetical protein WJX72_012005 [[Myrmecia] bisecta]|uniref:Uncharacterized protein n=1 Tax=[Myrmecia] bisecta TaxID=41462 RepID=A0AAW1QAC7_9CHLO